MIKIGDRVKFINDTGSGKVVSISGNQIEVDVVDGFVVPYLLTELVVVTEEEEIDVIKRVGVSDERPGRKGKGAATTTNNTPTPARTTKEPAYSRYGKISLVEEDYEEELLDMNRIDELYRRNKAATEAREREFEAIRIKQEEARSRVVESSPTITDSTPESNKKDDSNELDSLSSSLEEKVQADKQSQVKQVKEPKKPKNDIEVVDLHATEILDNPTGMSAGEIIVAQLARFTIALDLAIKSGKRGKMIFIHGVGSGKLRREIDLILRRDYPKVISQDASFKEYGYGAILVIY